MRADVIRVVEAYIEAVRDNDCEGLPLHPDVVFESPLNTIRGVAAFHDAMAKFAPILTSVEIEHLTADDDTCAAVLKLNTIFGLIPFLEFFRIKDGQIVAIRAYYDPRPILEGMSLAKPGDRLLGARWIVARARASSVRC